MHLLIKIPLCILGAYGLSVIGMRVWFRRADSPWKTAFSWPLILLALAFGKWE